MSDCPEVTSRSTWKQLLDLGSQLTAQQSVGDQGQLIIDVVSRELGSHVELWLAQDLGRPPGQRALDPSPSHPPTDLMRRAVESEQSVTQPSPTPNRACAVAIPLLVQRELLGAVQVQRPESRPLTPDEVDLLECVSRQWAVALKATHQLAMERWRARQLDLVRQVSAQIASVLDLTELASQLVDLILQTFDYYYVALFVLDHGRQELRLEASTERAHQPSAQDRAPPIETVRLGDGIIGQVAQTGREIVAADVRQEPHYRHVDSLPDTQSEVALPLRVETRVIGVLDLQSDCRQEIHSYDLPILRALAESVAVAVEHAQMYESLERRAEQFSVIAEANRAAASALEEGQLLDQVVALIHEHLGYPSVHLYTIDPIREQVILRASRRDSGIVPREVAPAFSIDDTHDIIPWVARHGETELENEVEGTARFPVSPTRTGQVRSELAVPLISSGQVLGVLDVQSDSPAAFDMDTYFMFRALADTVAVAIRNANLYRTERFRRQVADSMREVAGLLSSEMVLEEVLSAILVELERTLPCRLVAICMLEDSHLAIAAARGKAAQQALAAFPTSTGSWLSEVLDSEQPAIRPHGSPYDPIAEQLGLPVDYSAIAAPLRAGDQQLGLLYMAHKGPARYGAESQVILSAFASYAAVAIENARIYRSAQEQALVSAVMLQVAEATQSLSTLEDVLDTIVRLTPLLVGVSRCAILLWDKPSVAFLPAAAHGLTPSQQERFESWRVDLDRLLVFQEAFIEKSPLVVYDTWQDPRTADAELPLLGFESLLALPLLAQGEMLGTMLVDYGGDRFAYDTAPTVRDEQLTILQGIAHQTAAAIENASLREAREQDAYISAALLQVAQTTAAQSDVDEVLSSIVRITPILVGVERCMLFQWDKANEWFQVTHTYGLPRETEAVLAGDRYAPGDFEWLDEIWQRNEVLAYAPPAKESMTDWQHLFPSSFAATVGYVPDGPGALLGVPLAVKGEVLGVMILEEPPQVSTAQEKRIEIITGIAQQAAMALQNDQLQQERLAREGLEREMQLAQEIQRTFIPDEFPVLAGWEIATVWRAARQVTGDFYDLIDLPAGKLGLFIADAADKGMAAALFVTLTRTLLRAAARETASPAGVLDQVNDLLVPDAKRGMFVTGLFAVVSPDSGQVLYANAGHNPPLVLRSQAGKVESLDRGGTALGVIQGAQSRGSAVELDPGDCLVLFTDGVTEALSPEGDFYGRERLCELLLEETTDSAQQLLDAIDRSVSLHRGTAAASDDLTLVVLHRLPD